MADASDPDIESGDQPSDDPDTHRGGFGEFGGASGGLIERTFREHLDRCCRLLERRLAAS